MKSACGTSRQFAARSNSVAFGVKRTLSEPRLQSLIYGQASSCVRAPGEHRAILAGIAASPGDDSAAYDAAAAATPVPIGQDTPVPPSPQ